MIIGLISKNRKNIFEDKLCKINDTKISMKNYKISPSKAEKFGVKIAKDGVLRTAEEVLSRNSIKMSKIREIWPEIPFFNKEIDEQIEINCHYKGYLKKQDSDILAFKRDENLIIPESINYEKLSGLSNEIRSKFKTIKPKTLGQALRIDGVTPAAAYILLSHVKRKSIKRNCLMDNISFQDYFKKYNINVSRETCNDLELFVELIIQENSLINLISRTNINKHYIMERHIVDSLQIVDFIDFNHKKIVDLGSGSGFPGIVTAIIAKHKNTSMDVELFEKSFHKSKFLKKVSEKLNLKTKIIQSDIFHEERKEKS